MDNTREFDPSFLTADLSKDPSSSTSNEIPTESAADIASDPFASYFSSDSTAPPKVLITTSAKATRVTYEFCDELVGIFPGAEFHKRPKTRGFEMGKIAGWAAGRGFGNMIIVNEDRKVPSTSSSLSARCVSECRTLDAITMIHLPDGPTAYFKLTSIELTKKIFVCCVAIFKMVITAILSDQYRVMREQHHITRSSS